MFYKNILSFKSAIPDWVSNILLYDIGENSNTNYCEKLSDTEMVFYTEQTPINQNDLSTYIEEYGDLFYGFFIQTEKIEKENWNQKWEDNFRPIVINEKLGIRASFHETLNLETEIIINPKMSFGTGHHGTTFLCLDYLSHQDLSGKKVFDLGCGSGILGVLCLLKKANYLYAIDIDDWCIANSIENLKLNGFDSNYTVEKNNITLIKDIQFDIIVANINLIYHKEHFSYYSRLLTENGTLLLSGILNEDFEEIFQIAQKNNFTLKEKKEREKWLLLIFYKN